MAWSMRMWQKTLTIGWVSYLLLWGSGGLRELHFASCPEHHACARSHAGEHAHQGCEQSRHGSEEHAGSGHRQHHCPVCHVLASLRCPVPEAILPRIELLPTVPEPLQCTSQWFGVAHVPQPLNRGPPIPA